MLVLVPVLIWSMFLLYRGLPVVLATGPNRGMLMASALIAYLLVALVSLLGITVALWDTASGRRSGPEVDNYEDRVVTAFMYCSVLWALLGMLAGVYVAAELVWPTIDWGLPAVVRPPAHGAYDARAVRVRRIGIDRDRVLQRTSHVRLFAPWLAWAIFYAWQAAIVLGAVSILAGWNAGKEYAELEWPFDLAITAAWVGFAVVFFGTIAKRKIDAIYISNWFYGALIIVVAMLHIVNSLALPVTVGKSYSLFAGAQDAVVQWWYGHNAVGFLLTGGFLGMLYYFLPKQAEQPIWSYRLLDPGLLGVRLHLYLGRGPTTCTITPCRNGCSRSAWS